MTPNALARLLDGFNIHPGEVRIKDQVLRGYKIEQFADAFSRYVPVGDGGKIYTEVRIPAIPSTCSDGWYPRFGRSRHSSRARPLHPNQLVLANTVMPSATYAASTPRRWASISRAAK